MTTKEKIIEGLAELDDAGLAKVHAVVRDLTKPKPAKSTECIMDKLRRIKIDAPPDFSQNLDQYLNGEKSLDDIH